MNWTKCGAERRSFVASALGLTMLATAMFMTPATALADVGDVINVQGRLLSQAGTAVPDGDYTLTLGFYQTKAASKALYTYIAVAVPVKGGLFYVRVGDKLPLETKHFVSAEAGWLGITVGSEAELPRLPLYKVPYAIRADHAATAATATTASAVSCTGCIGKSHLDATYTATLVSKTDLAAVATSGAFKDLKDVPAMVTTAQTCGAGQVAAGIDAQGKLTCVTDKNDATVYTGKDFALSNQKCGSGQVLAGIDAAGKATCVADTDTDTKYTGKDFALANQKCGSGQVLAGVDAAGKAVCVTDKDTDTDTKYTGKDFALSNKTCPADAFMRGVNAAGEPNCIKPAALGITVVKGWTGRSGSSAGWTSSGGWGEPLFSKSAAHTATEGSSKAGAETMDFSVPSGMKTVWISILSWNNGGYFDILLKSGGVWKFHRRLSSFQAVTNVNSGGTHDSNIIMLAATGLDHFTDIRIQNRKGRIYFTGLGFSADDMQGGTGSGFTHWDNVSDKPKVQYSAAIPADQLTQAEVTNLRAAKLDDGTTPWVMGADDFTQAEVNNLRAGKLDDGTTPWVMGADDFTQAEVNNLRAGKLDDGTTPWTDGAKHNHTYDVNNEWLRENGDNAHVKLYGNSRALVMRTDGATAFGATGAYPFMWLYKGDAAANRLMFLNEDGQLWLKNYGWLHDKFQPKGSYLPTAGGTITGNLTVNGTATVGNTLNANNGIAVDGKTVIDNGAGWHRSHGQTGWYSETYGGGIYMVDTTWVRVYNNKSFYAQGKIQSDTGVYVGGTHVAKGNQACASGELLRGFDSAGNKLCTAGATGVVFRRWGRTSCPSGTTTLYWGYMAKAHYGHSGSGNDYQCLHRDPQYFTYNTGNHDQSLIYGVEYETNANAIGKTARHDYEAPCAVCYATTKNTEFMQPGRYTCPTGWTTEYNGYLMAERHNHNSSNWICVDKDMTSIGSSGNLNGGLLYSTEAECGALPCSSGKYQQNKELTCAVCTK